MKLWFKHLWGQDAALLCLSREVTNFPLFHKGWLSAPGLDLSALGSVQVWEGRTKAGTPRAGACECLWWRSLPLTQRGYCSVAEGLSCLAPPDKASKVILASKLLAVMASGHSSSSRHPALAFQSQCCSSVLHSSLTCRAQQMSNRCCQHWLSLSSSVQLAKNCASAQRSFGHFCEYRLVKGRKNEIEHKHTCNPPPGDSQRKTDKVPQGLHGLSTQAGGFTMFVFIHKLADSVST